MSQSSLDNLKDFEARIKRIEGGARKSKRSGHKSTGEYFRKEEERRRRRKKGKKANWTARILLMLIAFGGVKTYIMGSMGPEAYDARMAELQDGEKFEKMAFMVMQADPVTSKLQELLANYGVFEANAVPEEIVAAPVAVPVEEPAVAAAAETEAAAATVAPEATPE